MNRETRRAIARVAQRPPARTVTVVIDEGAFDGWSATARADFPASLLLEFDSGNATRIVAALRTIVVEHNMPNSAGKLAATVDEVDPYDGLLAIAAKITEAIGRLPPR